MTAPRLIACLLVALIGTAAVRAEDRLTLIGGDRLRGEFISADRDTVRMRVDGEVVTLPRDTVERITFVPATTPSLVNTRLVVETGFPIEARLRTALSARHSRRGERFEAELLTPIVATSGQQLASSGDSIWGRVVHAERPRRPGERGLLDVELAEVRMEGRTRVIKTTLGRKVDGSATAEQADSPEYEVGTVLGFVLSQTVTIRPSRY